MTWKGFLWLPRRHVHVGACPHGPSCRSWARGSHLAAGRPATGWEGSFPPPRVSAPTVTQSTSSECNLLPSRNFHLGLRCKGWSLAGVFFWMYLVIIKKAIQGLEPENCNSTIGKKQQSKTPVSSVRLGSPDPHVPRESYLRDIGSASHTPHFRCACNVTLA